MIDVPSPPASSAFSPLRQPIFAVLWAATILGNVGSFMRDVASGWLVTDLTGSPTAVAMIQVAGTLPIFLLAIPAGVLSDIIDRRKLLIGVQVLLGLVSASLMTLALTDRLTIELLVGLTFLGGVGAALMGPTWQSIVPELVPRSDMRNAVALNSLGFNIARSIGPAIGGALLVAFGAAATYGADVLSYVFVVAALLWWKRPAGADDALREQFGGAFRAGLRYARASSELHRVLLRALLFFLCASSVWALLPLVARNLLQGSAGFYGLLLGAVGAGAIIGAILLPRLRTRIDADGIMLGAALTTAAVTAALAASPPQALAVVLLLVLGGAWIAALTTLNGTVQAILPNWVRGRGLAIYLTVFNGASAAGSLFWGLVAEALGVRGALMAAALALAVIAFAVLRLRLPAGGADLTPSAHWPEPAIAATVEHDRGPVTVTIEYRVRQEDRAAFLAAIARLAPERRRDGAFAWGVSEDAAAPENIVEWFMVESWAEHLRQHRRVSQADADIQTELARFHTGEARPSVRHLLALSPGRARR
ncbi:MAG TPA: MFS transporter [Bosea sp. (in: a-proteobacteria)]|jgi:MFS family permease|uniref:MFS transporter n=1 Tax=Bosea sp. (in: a-proteobacteria) TaxID=1871050 RepID=UPI002DDD8C1D|nr:MFS transporter [Bosea sp. (in: a-proteobacteria)]HEV2553338.1 MFS transporter [Bosea sp. (in: a-proteobacteria)]